MKATVRSLAIFIFTLAAASFAQADPYCSPVFHVPLPPAPDTSGPGFYTYCPNGMIYGPGYWLRPAWAPYNGPAAPFMGQQNPFRYHEYVRGPRDFFMWRENMEDQMRRSQRPALLP